MFHNYRMSSVADHVQLMKSQESKYNSVFNKREWLSINDTTTQYDQGRLLFPIIPSFKIITADI